MLIAGTSKVGLVYVSGPPGDGLVVYHYVKLTAWDQSNISTLVLENVHAFRRYLQTWAFNAGTVGTVTVNGYNATNTTLLQMCTDRGVAVPNGAGGVSCVCFWTYRGEACETDPGASSMPLASLPPWPCPHRC